MVPANKNDFNTIKQGEIQNDFNKIYQGNFEMTD